MFDLTAGVYLYFIKYIPGNRARCTLLTVRPLLSAYPVRYCRPYTIFFYRPIIQIQGKLVPRVDTRSGVCNGDQRIIRAEDW